jgi:tyrosine-protein kinase
MTALQVRDVLIKQAWLIAVCALSAGFGGLIATALITPLYQSTVVMRAVVSPATPNTYALLVLDRLIGTEAQHAVSQPVLKAVVSKYPGLTAEELRAEVAATPEQNTQLLQIMVMDPSPARAAALATDIASALIADQQNTMAQRNAQAELTLRNEISTTKSAIADATAKLNQPNITPNQAANLEAQVQGLQEEYNTYLTAYAALQRDDALHYVTLFVDVPATLNPNAVRPVLVVNVAAGLACGVLFGVLLALAGAQLDQRVRRPETVTELVNWPLLAAAGTGQTASVHARSAPPYAATSQPPSLESEGLYSALHKTVELATPDSVVRSLAVTSPHASNAAGAIAASWAAFLGRRRVKALLVDADLAHPSLAKRVGLNPTRGLSDAAVAFGQPGTPVAALPSFFQPATSVGAPGLSLVAAGTPPPDPTLLLESQAMGRVFTAMLSCGADAIIFATPPILDKIRARKLHASVGGVVIVLDLAHLRKYELMHMRHRLTQMGARVLGFVAVDSKHIQSMETPVADDSGGGRIGPLPPPYAPASQPVGSTGNPYLPEQR